MEKKRHSIPSNSSPVSRMNELPDEILSLILSNLTLKQAARTCVLSHRWVNLWIYITGSLNFDLSHVLRGKYFVSREKPAFKNWVNQILNLHRGPTLDEFRVRFDLDGSDGDDIQRWIEFAIQKGVCRFELDFSKFDGYVKWYRCCYVFPSWPINVSRSFGSLISLRLTSADLCDQVLAYFISNCQFLKHLVIKGADSLTCLDATTALKLKHLEVEYCLNLKKFDISNTNIESLNFDGAITTCLSFEKLPLLSEVSLGSRWCIRVVHGRFRLLPISQLQRLVLYMGVWVKLVAGYHQSIFCLTSLTCASPQLISFTLKVRYIEPSDEERLYELPNCEWRKSEKCVHQCLKVVEFSGWYGFESDLDLVSYLIINSPVLEKVIIDPKNNVIDNKSLASVVEREERSRESARLLQEKVPPGTEFVLL